MQAIEKKLKGGSHFSSEEAIYKKAALPFVLPEMRENVAEWKFTRGKSNLTSSFH